VKGVSVESIVCNERLQRSGRGWCFPRAVESHLRSATAGRSVLHLFGGRARFGVCLDIDPIVRPDVVGDAYLPPFKRDSFDVVVLDPPYTYLNAQEKISLFRAAAWIARVEVWWFHTVWMAGAGGLVLRRGWTVVVGGSCAVRALQVFDLSVPKKPPYNFFTRGPAMRYNRWLQQPSALPFPSEVVQDGR
jgi:hypothetical protein